MFSSSAQTLTDRQLQFSELVAGLSQPTAMAFIGPSDILKADGRVRRITNGVLQPGQVLDLAVDSNSERGLLGCFRQLSLPSIRIFDLI